MPVIHFTFKCKQKHLATHNNQQLAYNYYSKCRIKDQYARSVKHFVIKDTIQYEYQFITLFFSNKYSYNLDQLNQKII